jgi:hypothetical protein
MRCTAGVVIRLPYVDGSPLRLCNRLTPELLTYRGPVNAIDGTAATPDHTFKVVIVPDADAPYSMALLGLRSESAVI